MPDNESQEGSFFVDRALEMGIIITIFSLLYALAFAALAGWTMFSGWKLQYYAAAKAEAENCSEYITVNSIMRGGLEACRQLDIRPALDKSSKSD